MSQTKIESPFLSLQEASEYLKLKPSTLYSYTHKRVIPFYKLRGRKIYFRKEDLDNFIMNDMNLVKSKKQITSDALTNIVSGK
ncbi:MAG: helix-turn-helix domain-containing protein [Candidatus Cloacimonetes bacterium]|nr:helix-turn-helix domain-containing protein [Candidatus Cloacimonadota bacterium]